MDGSRQVQTGDCLAVGRHSVLLNHSLLVLTMTRLGSEWIEPVEVSGELATWEKR